MRKKIIIFIGFIVLAIVGYNYVYQEHRDIKSEDAKYQVTSNEIALQFTENPKRAAIKHLNTTIEVTGTVSENDSNTITLDDNVFCQFNIAFKNTIVLGSKIKIKGRVIGYDDLLEQVKLDQCTIIE